MLILDDGVQVYNTVADAEQSQETLDIGSNPDEFGYGYDSSGQGLRLIVKARERRFLGIKSLQEYVALEVDPHLDLSQDKTVRDKLIEYLLRTNSSLDGAELNKRSVQELLKLTFKR